MMGLFVFLQNVSAAQPEPSALTAACENSLRCAGKLLLNGLNHLEVQRLRVFKLAGAVAGADSRRQRIAAGLLHELDCLFRFSQATPPVPVTADY